MSSSSPEKFNNKKQGLQAVIKLEGFRLLWIGQIFSQLADKFYIILMVYLIAQYWANIEPQAHNDLTNIASTIRIDIENRAEKITLLATGIYAANTLPAILLGMIAGVWADRWPKRKVMVGSNALRAILVTIIPICLLPTTSFLGISWGYWAVVSITLLESILTQFFAPAEQATIPLLVPSNLLLAANSLYQATSMVATIIGFALGEPIIRLLKQIFNNIGFTGGEFLLLPFCYGIAALSLSNIQIKESKGQRTFAGFWEEINDGIQVIVKKPSVQKAMRNLVLLYSLLAAMYVIAISLAGSIAFLGPTGFGTLLAMSGLGMTLGALIMAQLGHLIAKHHLGAAGLVSITFSLVMLSELQGHLILTLILCIILGIGSSLVAIPAQTILQEDTPEEERGRVFGLQNNLINIALSIPLVLAGTLVSRVGLEPVLLLLAAFTFAAALMEQPWKRY